ncbi:MAG TPA: 2,3-bisphosphoglycerate-independent phosphoglycerate mutase, partial [Pyrinomonadaceae bacterium]|nr:2,3-bisphosphoglycerate-independent phosphoglycerate mutase [Pyrinomonadaceae bacterium]
VVDGLGGLGHPDFDFISELEYAKTPNLDKFVSLRTTEVGLLYPVNRGITPGSGPGHLGLFGYDPLKPKYTIGRGALEAAGLEFTLRPNDLIFRMNFSQIGSDGILVDRRAGRISSQEGARLSEKLNKAISLRGAEAIVVPSRDYRASLILRTNQALSDQVRDTDPQREGFRPESCLPIDSRDPGARRTADLVNSFVEQAAKILSDEPKANMVLLRGASRLPNIPRFGQIYGLQAAASAIYPLYRGIARLVGMDVLNGATNLAEQIAQVKTHFDDYTFFFVHFKDADSAGEDGDFLRKVKAIEYVDQQFPSILEIGFDVIAITGDHSTPSLLRGHSWHSVPLAVSGPYIRRDDATRLTEYECAKGGLGRLRTHELMNVLMANAGKLKKFGA